MIFSHRSRTLKPDNIFTVLCLALLLINCYVTPVSALFGLRTNPKSKSNSTCSQTANHIAESKSAESKSVTDHNTTFVHEAWRDKDGNLLTIRAVQEPSGVWRMPEGTILPKDPVSMARIVEIGNDLGEIFHCVLPKRKKPHNAEWLDIPQVPVIEDISTAEAESHLRVLEGKCYYRQQGWWTYEFCYKSHVRQFHMDMNTKKITEEYMLGYYNASNSFEVHSRPDRLDHTPELDVEGPAWTTSLVTVYGGGDAAVQLGSGGWYAAEWERRRLLGIVPLFRCYAHKPGSMHTRRPRQAAVMLRCLVLEEGDPLVDRGGWLDRAQVQLDGDRVPFDMRVFESSLGLYEIQIRSAALCGSELLRAETKVELSPFGNMDEEVTCQSLESGQIYKLEDVPASGRLAHKFRQASSPFDFR